MGLGNGPADHRQPLHARHRTSSIKGKLHTQHCTNSTSQTYDGDQWVRVEVLVHGDELVRHIVDGADGARVLEAANRRRRRSARFDPAVKIDGTPMTGGYISLQAETAPIDFRKVELLNLEGCTDRVLARATGRTSSSRTRRCAAD